MLGVPALSRQFHTLSPVAPSAAAARPWRRAVVPEFTQRQSGLTGLVRACNLQLKGEPMPMDLGLLYAALKMDRVDLAAANAAGGMPALAGFELLADDRHCFPLCEYAIAIRDDRLQRVPGVVAALAKLSRISGAAMCRVNQHIDIERNVRADDSRELPETPT